MEKLKKIWLWISGGIVALFGLIFFFSGIAERSKEKRQFKKDKKKLEDDFKDTQKKIDEVVVHKQATKEEIEKTKKKIKETKSKVKDTKDAVDTLKDFKKKHKK